MMCDSYPVPVALSRPASQALFGPREMLAVAGAEAQSTSAKLVLAQVALPDAMLALCHCSHPLSAHDCEQVGSCGLAVEER